jgi:hypothetical protein
MKAHRKKERKKIYDCDESAMLFSTGRGTLNACTVLTNDE